MKHYIFFCLYFFLVTHSAQAQIKNPILLIHGATMGGHELKVGPLHLGEYFQGVPEYLRSLGATVEQVGLPSSASIEERAFVVKNFLETRFKGQKVNIIAHSLGGLDARYLVSALHSSQVISITTVGTPHHGTPLADWVNRQMREKKIWFQLFRFLGYDMHMYRYLPELTTDFMEQTFNPKVRDREDVKYFSVVGSGDPWNGTLSALIFSMYIMLKSDAHPMSKEMSDGVVPISSQRWGTVLTELPLDHLAQINHYTFRWPHTAESLAMYAKIFSALEQQGL